MKCVYGPVFSWRLGYSLGIDPISQKEKIYSFDCIYCQIGRTDGLTARRKTYFPVQKIVDELKSLPPVAVDYLTFSGRDEPTLARNLAEMIKAVRTIRKEPIAILTNSSLMHRADVRKDLMSFDFVVAKLDAWSQESLGKINRPFKGINFEMIVNGLKKFRGEYKGRLALQIMFIDENKNSAREISQIAREINPDEVQINTPLRPGGAKPLSKEEISKIKEYFAGMNTISVYEVEKKKVKPISGKETLKRRGKFREFYSGNHFKCRRNAHFSCGNFHFIAG